MLAPLIVVSKVLLPHFAQIGINLLRFIHSGINYCNTREHKYLMLKIFLKSGLLHIVKVE